MSFCFGGEERSSSTLKFCKGKGIKLIYVGVQLCGGFFPNAVVKKIISKSSITVMVSES